MSTIATEAQIKVKQDLPHILCVDDEPAILEGLTLSLGRRYVIATATSGCLGLKALTNDPTICVVISDMQMPEMDGAAFLARVAQIRPETVRILLTGQAKFESAIAAVNEGKIYRLLTKPCPPIALLTALEGAVQQHRLVMSEKVLLEQTLYGSIKALTDVLSLVSPISFGRANRIKRTVARLAEKLQFANRWQLEVAAMLSQLGMIILPGATAEKIQKGLGLTDSEREMIARLPRVTEQLLSHIPRLEVVRAIISYQNRDYASLQSAVPAPDQEKEYTIRGAQIIIVVTEWDLLQSLSQSVSSAIASLRARKGRFDSRVVDALEQVLLEEDPLAKAVEVPFSGLHAGMVLAEDMLSNNGTLLITRGFEITDGLLERLHNFHPRMVKEPIRIYIK
ncbi:MAG: response regulator [Planctomycetes bacterium]|nr:response regulator [Planctomycetota bacterium]